MDKITCPECNTEIEVNPAAMLGSHKKTMTPAAMESRRKNLQDWRDSQKKKKKKGGEVK